jgi:hypothetical protein
MFFVSFSVLVFAGHWEKMTVFMWNCKKRKRKKWGEIKRKEIFCRRPKREENWRKPRSLLLSVGPKKRKG